LIASTGVLNLRACLLQLRLAQFDDRTKPQLVSRLREVHRQIGLRNEVIRFDFTLNRSRGSIASSPPRPLKKGQVNRNIAKLPGRQSHSHRIKKPEGHGQRRICPGGNRSSKENQKTFGGPKR
jgi:hypothetical protein